MNKKKSWKPANRIWISLDTNMLKIVISIFYTIGGGGYENEKSQYFFCNNSMFLQKP